MSKNIEMDRDLARRLAALHEQPQRDPQAAARGREQFLMQAREVKKAREAGWPMAWTGIPRFDAEPVQEAVSSNGKVRHNRWMHALQKIFNPQPKERSPMFGTIGTVLLIFSLILGGTGATVVAAQDSLPDQGLYPVKTWSEEVRAGLTTNEQSRLQLALDLVDRRAEEMQVMLRAGKTPSELVRTRMQNEIDLALQLAAGRLDEEVPGTLEQIRERLQEHEQAFLHLGPQADPQAEALLEQTRTMLRDRLKLCEDGILDPEALRDRDRLHQADQEQGQDQTPGQGQDQTQDQNRDQLHQGDQDQTPDQTQDQTRDRLHQGDQEPAGDQEQEQNREQQQESKPESGNPEGGNPESGNPESGTPNAGNPESGNPESGNSESGTPESGNPGGGGPNSGGGNGGNGGQ